MRKSFLFVALAALALVGCNDKTQSELTEETLGLNGEAKITVKFYYNEGTKLVDGVEVSETLPVPASCKVVAKVDYSEYTGAAKGESFKQFAATAKGNGVYEVVIPAGEKEITVDIIANGFTADYYLTPEKKIQAYYQTKVIADINNGVLAGQEVLEQNPANTTLAVDPNIINNDRQAIIKLITGKLSGKIEKWDSDDKKLEAVDKGLEGQTIELEIKSKNKDDKRVLTYFAQTAADGSFKFEDVAIYDEWSEWLEDKKDTVTMTLKVKEWADVMKHYYKSVDGDVVKALFSTKADYEGTHDKASFATEKEWSDHLDALKDGTDPMYILQGASQDVTGSWKVKDTGIGNVYGVVKLFGESLNNDLTAEFAPADLKAVLGVGSYQLKTNAKCDNGDAITVLESTISDASNILGWK
jgi:hypothetical protein